MKVSSTLYGGNLAMWYGLYLAIKDVRGRHDGKWVRITLTLLDRIINEYYLESEEDNINPFEAVSMDDKARKLALKIISWKENTDWL